MAKLLKLIGAGSYVSPRIKNNHVVKGQVIRVSDEVAAKLQEGFERVGTEEVPHWIEVAHDTPVDVDCVSDAKQAPAPAPAPEPEPKAQIEEAGEAEQASPAPAPAPEAKPKRVATQRKTRSTATK